MKKQIAVVGIFSLLISCGGNEGETVAENGSSEVEQESSAEEVVLGDEMSEEVVEEGREGPMQIDDYAALLLEADIKASSDEMSYENGDQHFFQINDVKGGYAEVTGAYEGAYEFALWRMADGSDLVGQTSRFCGPVCGYSHQFFKFDAEGNKTDVTTDILPWKEIDAHKENMAEAIREKEELEYEEDVDLWFQLPRKGTSMEVSISMGANEIEAPMMKLSWDKEKFSVEAKYMDWK